jgi:hypothetical protein
MQDAGTTKNDAGRVVYLTPELRAMLAAQVERVKELERQAKASFRRCSHASEDAAEESRLEISGRHGPQRVRGLAFRAGLATTSGGRRFATWSTRVVLGASRRG